MKVSDSRARIFLLKRKILCFRYLGESCFNNVTQQEGICKKLLHCKKPCAPNSEEKVYCKRPPRGMPIVCCPLARTTSTISALSNLFSKIIDYMVKGHPHFLQTVLFL